MIASTSELKPKKTNKQTNKQKTKTKQKPYIIHDTTFAILPFSHEKKLPSWVLWSLLFWRNHQMHFKMVHSNKKNAKSKVCQSQVFFFWFGFVLFCFCFVLILFLFLFLFFFYAQPIPLLLKVIISYCCLVTPVQEVWGYKVDYTGMQFKKLYQFDPLYKFEMTFDL